MTTTIPSTTEWAKENGTPFSWSTVTDNHEPPRGYAAGKGWFYTMPDEDVREDGIILLTGELRDPHEALYLVDDGITVRPFYVAGWKEADPSYVMLHAMPTNINKYGERRMRPDGRGEVDFANWVLGPRRAYHLKVTTTERGTQ